MSAATLSSGLDRGRIESLVAEVLRDRLIGPTSTSRSSQLVVNVSARHMHISPEHLEILFGAGMQLTPMRSLYQEGQFASEQTVDLVGPRRRMLSGMRILGPVRPSTQIELAFSDAVNLGIDAPVRMSGRTSGTPGCLLVGPKGHLWLEEGVIRAQRHVHMSPDDAVQYGVAQGDDLDLVVEHPTCPLTMHGIKVRVDPSFKLEVHVDTDEGNACDLPNATSVRLVKPGS